MSTSRAAIVALLIAFPQFAQAQLAEARPGARVRLEAPGVLAGRFEGTIIARTVDTVTVASQNTAPIAVPVARIATMEISRGSSRSDGAIRGTAWGAGIGTVIGVLFIPAARDCTTCRNRPSEVEVVSQTALAGAVWGAIIGAIAGRERWERYDLSPRVAVSGDGRVGLSLTLGR